MERGKPQYADLLALLAPPLGPLDLMPRCLGGGVLHYGGPFVPLSASALELNEPVSIL